MSVAAAQSDFESKPILIEDMPMDEEEDNDIDDDEVEDDEEEDDDEIEDDVEDDEEEEDETEVIDDAEKTIAYPTNNFNIDFNNVNIIEEDNIFDLIDTNTD